MIVGFIVFVWRRESGLLTEITVRLSERGFTRETSPPSVTAGPRLDPRWAWRGALRSGHTIELVLGRGFGEALSTSAQMASSGHNFYLWALVPTAGCDDAWLARFDGDARAERTGDRVLAGRRSLGYLSSPPSCRQAATWCRVSSRSSRWAL